MNRRVTLWTLACLLAAGGSVKAQDHGDFDSFRAKMLSDYQGFRKDVLDNYADYLDGVWKEYTLFAGGVRSTAPKPDAPVVFKAPAVETPPVDLPSAAPAAPVDAATPSAPVVQAPVASPVNPTPVAPAPAAQPVTAPQIRVDYYGLKWSLPAIDLSDVTRAQSNDCAVLWRKLAATDAKAAVPALRQTATTYGLNDWFTFQLVRKYADAVAASARNIDRVTLQHYLLANMGYDVRLARSDRQYFLLVPFEQTVYARNYLKTNTGSFYAFEDEADGITEKSPSIFTYDLPGDVDCGRKLNLRIDAPIKISSGTSQVRQLQVGAITLLGDVDATVMEMLRHYPQTDVPVYAVSNPDPVMREAVITQFKPYVEDKSEAEAVKLLLHFAQYAFDYATDDQQHGYEKPYFFEENFYYPQNDCEDRAVFFAYLVRKLLHLDVQLIHYPGHECTAVHFTDTSVTGDGFLYNGKRYLICDPTYIGAAPGKCMPDFRQTQPVVEEW